MGLGIEGNRREILMPVYLLVNIFIEAGQALHEILQGVNV